MEPQPLFELEEPREANVNRDLLVSQVGIPGREPNPVCHRIGVVVDVEPGEYRERAAGLGPDDAAQLEVVENGLLRPGRDKVGDEAVPNILVRIGPFQVSCIQILRRADERRKSSVVKRLRKGVVGAQPEILAGSFVCLQRQPVKDRVAAVVGVIHKAGIVFRSAEQRLTVRKRWQSTAGDDDVVAITGCSSRRSAGDIQVLGPDQLVGRNE